MGLLLLVVVMLVSLVLIPFGLPGLWLMIVGAVSYSLLLPGSIGWVTLVGACVLALVAEVLEFTLTGNTRESTEAHRAPRGVPSLEASSAR
jgi:hypothetical protein